MSNQKESGNFGVQVIAGALAAATAALLGSTLGVAGTVVGAGIASVVTTIGAALYLRSLQRTRQGVRLVQDKVLSRWTGEIPKQPEKPDEQPEPDARRKRRVWAAVAAASVVAFALGMLAITGLEMVRGENLSGGQGTTLGRIVRPEPGPAKRPDPTPPPATTTPSRPGGTSSVPAPPPPTTSQPPTSSQPPTTTAPPTTTTAPPAPTATPPPSELGNYTL